MPSFRLNRRLIAAPCVLALSSLAASAFAGLQTRFTYLVTAPDSRNDINVWFPIPSDNPFQTVKKVEIRTGGPSQIATEPKFGNRIGHVKLPPYASRVITVTIDVDRGAGTMTKEIKDDPSKFLSPDSLVPIDGRYAEIADGVVGSATSPKAKLKQIFDHTVAEMQYDYKKESPKLGMGDVAFVCDYKKGNCSDLHSYIISLARAEGIPSFLEYGFPVTGIPITDIPKTGKIGGYHCWTWAYIEGEGWMPLDASDARRWKDSGKPETANKLFGNLIVERSAVAFSRGRDIQLIPPQKGAPLNNFIYPYAEEDGKPVEAKWEVSYELLNAPATQAAEKPTVTPYGFVRLDTIYDTQRPNPNNQFPFWINSPDQTGGDERDRFGLHARLTRFGVNVLDPRPFAGGWKANAQIEFDFQGGGTESRPNPRGRIMWASANKGATSIGFGQHWDLVGPLNPSPNDDSMMWNTGNVGDRRAQLRYTHDNGTNSFAIAATATGVIDQKDLDNDGVRDGEDSGVPGIQARFGIANKTFKGGLWGYVAKEETSAAVGGEKKFDTSLFGADFQFTLSPKTSLKGEVWSGKNLSDIRGGVGQGVNTTTGQEIDSQGGWVELGFMASPTHTLAVGYTLDDPDNGDVPNQGRTKNSAIYLHNKWNLGSGVEVGLNIISWETQFKGLSKGKDTRLNFFVIRRF